MRRLEILTDPGGRRRWSAQEKASIVAEATAPGAVVSQVARRYGLTPQQVFTWRRTLQSPAAQPMAFAPVVVETPPAEPPPAAAAIEIATGAVVVRVPAGADAATLRTVLRAVTALR